VTTESSDGGTVHNEMTGDGDGVTVQAGSIKSLTSYNVQVDEVNLITGVPIRTRYREQIRRIAPQALLDRAADMEELGRFCVDPSTAGCYWSWRAAAWSGKSALLSWFVLHPPDGVRIVSFFVTARLAGQNNRAAFIDNLMEQLLTVLGQPVPAFLNDATREAHLLGLLAEAARACQARGERFVLVVDGLDEDRGAHRGAEWHSIANLLPAQPPAGMRVIVAGRSDPPLPEDVPSDHPLRDPDVQRPLTASPHAGAERGLMHRELFALLQSGGLALDLLGLVVGAGGGLAADDLVELTGCAPWEVREHLRTVAGRSFTRRAGMYRSDAVTYLLAHEDLHVAARDNLGAARLSEYRDRIHAWADSYHDRHWPEDTPEYLLRGYSDMLGQENELPRLVTCATDPDRQERLLEASGGDGATLTEVTRALDLYADDPAPDLNDVTRLAQHRDRLRDRNNVIPTKLPSMWAALGNVNRAEATARMIPEHQGQQALAWVAQALAKRGEFDRAELVARSITSRGSREMAASFICRELATAGEFDRAEAVARAISDPLSRMQALISVAQLATEERDRAQVLLHNAREIAGSITEPDQVVQAQVSWAELLLTFGERDKARALLDQAETLRQSITKFDPLETVLASMAQAVARAGDIDRAEALARSIANPSTRARTLSFIGLVATIMGERERARAIFDPAMNPDMRDKTPFSRATRAAAAGEHQRAEELSRSIVEPSARGMALVSAAEAAMKAGDHDRARSLLRQAEAFARSTVDPAEWTKALVSVAHTVAEVGERDQARELLCHAEAFARSVGDPYSGALALASVAERMAATGEHGRARELVRQAETVARTITTSVSHQDWALATVAQAAGVIGDHEWIAAITQSIVDPAVSSLALTMAVQAAADAGEHGRAELIARSNAAQTPALLVEALARAGRLDQAQTIARAIDELADKVRALATTAHAMTEAGKPDQARALVSEAVSLSRSIVEPETYVGTLLVVAKVAGDAGDQDRARTLIHQAETVIDAITDPQQQATARDSLARAVAATGDYDRAAKIALSITGRLHQSTALMSVVEAMAETGAHDQAETLARSIIDPTWQASALGVLIDKVDPHRKPHLLATRMRLIRWYEGGPPLYTLATEAFNEGIQELTTREAP
jgi:tetratricopeptide (TPR) repeat protein